MNIALFIIWMYITTYMYAEYDSYQAAIGFVLDFWVEMCTLHFLVYLRMLQIIFNFVQRKFEAIYLFWIILDLRLYYPLFYGSGLIRELASRSSLADCYFNIIITIMILSLFCTQSNCQFGISLNVFFNTFFIMDTQICCV